MKDFYIFSRSGFSRIILFSGLSLLSLQGFGQATYMVTNSNDSGEGSLRAAIETANQNAEKDIIKFQIEEGEAPHRIFLQTLLPAIINPVVLNATDDLTGLPTVEINGRDLTLYPDQTEKELVPKAFFLIGGSSGSVIKGFILGGFGFVEELDGTETDYYPGMAIAVDGSGEHIIQANYFGVSIDGVTLMKNVFGITLNHGSYNMIGGPNPGDRNVFGGSWRAGVLSGFESNYNRFIGNYFGVSPDGTAAIPNSTGLDISFPSHNNHIEGNVAGGNEVGIRLVGINNTTINNLIGTNLNGTIAIPNKAGIVVHYGENQIGVPNMGNVISGNEIGIYLLSQYDITKNTRIQGNFIGTDKDGLLAIPNDIGIQITGNTSDNLIGGVNEGEGNIISGNKEFGIEILTPGNVVKANTIGLNLNGEPLGNGVSGINIKGARAIGNTIGDLLDGKNIVSSNGVNGVAIHEEANGTRILGNYIGTNKEGAEARGNGSRGIAIWPSTGTEVVGNLISGHSTHDANGIFVYTSSGHKIFDNKIGTNANGTEAIPNTIGIRLMDSSNNLIGGESPGEPNLISGNSSSGILLLYDNSINNRISRNNISGNGNIGIDLWPPGITPNDTDDKDTGSNLLQNFPEISSDATYADGIVSLKYLVPSKHTYSAFPLKIEFFLDDGNNQAKEYLATTEYTEADVRGKVQPKSFSFSIPDGSTLSPGEKILATATDANGNTSEFGAGVVVSGDCTLIVWYADKDGDGLGDPIDTKSSCSQPIGYVDNSDDCDDSDANVGAGSLWYADADGDTFGNPNVSQTACNQPEGFVANSDDCDDTNASVYPDATDVCNDCDPTNDVGCEVECLGTDILYLAEVCTNGDTVNWMITNPGNCTVEVRWELRKREDFGNLTVPPGESFFTSGTASKGPTQVTIYWNNSSGSETKTNANASGITCPSSSAIMGDEIIGDTDPAVKVYPNPVTSEGIWLHFAERNKKAQFKIVAYDLSGRKMAETLVSVDESGGDILWDVDHSRWIEGIYVLNISSGNEIYQIKILK